MQAVAAKFLGLEIKLMSVLPEDRSAHRCTQRRRPVVLDEPNQPLGRALADLARRLEAELDQVHPHGVGRVLRHRLGRVSRAAADV
jgi:septum formation inhibitor-activating ATPase MinD